MTSSYPTPLDGNYRPTRGDLIDVKAYGAQGNGIADDSIPIQAALNAVQNTSNSLIFFPSGTYLHNSDLTITGNNITIAGAGRSSILKNGTGNTANGLKISGANHILVRDLQIDGNRANIINPPAIGAKYTILNAIYITGSSDVTIDHCYIHDHYCGGILADTSNTLIISNNYVANGNDNGIFIRTLSLTGIGCSDITISGNICTGMAFSGIQGIFASYMTISNNVCYGNGPTLAQGDGVGIEGCAYVTISNNVCYSNGIQGISVRYSNETPGAANTPCTHITIAGNVCYNHTSADGDAGGMVISAVDDITVMGNLIYANYFGCNLTDTNGLSVTNAFFGDNIIRSNTNVGLRVGSTAITSMLLSDNFVADNASHNLYTITRIFVKGGIYKGATGAGNQGIYLDTGSSGSIIDGAIIYDNADNGILINAGANDEIRNCYFANIVGANQGRALYEGGGAGPTVMINNRIKAQANQPYFFNNATSRYYDHQTVASFTVTTAAYTASATDEILLCNRAGVIAITIPNPANMAGRLMTVKDISGAANTNNITVTGAAGTIDGAANKVINTAYGVLRLTNDGANWFTV